MTATQTREPAMATTAGSRRRPDRLTEWERIAAFGAGVLGALIIGAVLIATLGDPTAVVLAMCLVSFLTTPFTVPPAKRRGGGGS